MRKEDLRISEIYRYLGYTAKMRNAPQRDERTDRLIDGVLDKLLPVCTPRELHEEFALQLDEERVQIGSAERGMAVKSRGLSRFLRGCGRVILFGCTLGQGPDLLIRRYELSSLVKAAVVQAACAEIVECFADECMGKLREKYEPEWYLRPRFSPGYGDFDLAHQRDFFRLLPMESKLGVHLGEQLLMSPTKSITAVIGLTQQGTDCSISHCRICEKKDCEFSDNG